MRPLLHATVAAYSSIGVVYHSNELDLELFLRNSENLALPRSDGLSRQVNVTLAGGIIGFLCTVGNDPPILYIRMPLSIGPGLRELPRIPALRLSENS
jgi:hypothetical protein